MSGLSDPSRYHLAEVVYEAWVAYCVAEEALSEHMDKCRITDADRWFKHISIDIRVDTYDKDEGWLESNERHHFSKRDMVVDVGTIEEAIGYLKALRARYEDRPINPSVQAMLSLEQKETEEDRRVTAYKLELGVACTCNDPSCSKCLKGNCKDDECPTHTLNKKTSN